MARYIDADKLTDRCKEIIADDWNKRASPESWSDAYEGFIEDIDEQPTSDVVEVVRCKNCKYNVANMKKDPLDITDYSGDDIVCSYFTTDGLAPNDYCSHGKPQK